MKAPGIFILAAWLGLFGYQQAHPKMFNIALGDGPKVQLAANAMVDASGNPLRNRDGSYPLLLASMKAGQVTEITPDNVARWYTAVSQKIDKKDYWVIQVRYRQKSTLGSLYADADACVRDAKVEKWLYEGSGEVVP